MLRISVILTDTDRIRILCRGILQTYVTFVFHFMFYFYFHFLLSTLDTAGTGRVNCKLSSIELSMHN